MEKYGPNELPDKRKSLFLITAEFLLAPMPLMIWVAIIILAAIEQFLDMGILLFIQFANCALSLYEVTKSESAVKALKSTLEPHAQVKRDGLWQEITAKHIVPSDLVRLFSGRAVPADCRVHSSSLQVDQSQLTGESLPVSMYAGDLCKMGSTVLRGESEATVQFTGAYTYFGKTATLLGDEQGKSNLQHTIIAVVTVLTALSITFCAIALIWLLVGEKQELVESLRFTVVLLVASIPLAIEIIITTTLALGSVQLSEHGAIVTRLAAVEDAACLNILCTDKTGTLTLNKMELQQEAPCFSPGLTQADLLESAALAANFTQPPGDALDSLVFKSVDMAALCEQYQLLENTPFDPTQKRTESLVRRRKRAGEEGEEEQAFRFTKGAPHVILHLCEEGTTLEAQHAVEEDVKNLGRRGIRCLAIARRNVTQQQVGVELDEPWSVLGLLTFLDPERPDTKLSLLQAREQGIHLKMVTGDHLLVAREMARRLELGEDLYPASVLPVVDAVSHVKPPRLKEDYGDLILGADGFAGVFPEHKYLIVECLRELVYKVGMTGDGVNDAPALKIADVGIAVDGATDAAGAAADIQLTQPGLAAIIDGIVIAREIFVRIRNFLTYRIAATLQLLFFFFIAVFAFKPVDYDPTWPVYFSLPVLLLMLITLLNDGTMISVGYDNVVPSKTPAVWNLRVLFTVGGVLAAVACLSSLILLYMLLVGSFGDLTYGQITASIYLKVSVSDFLTLFSARTHDGWFWSAPPSTILVLAATTSLAVSTIIACTLPPIRLDGVPVEGIAQPSTPALAVYIWLYCLGWWLVQDSSKVLTHYLLRKYHVFGYGRTGELPHPIRMEAAISSGLSTPRRSSHDSRE